MGWGHEEGWEETWVRIILEEKKQGCLIRHWQGKTTQRSSASGWSLQWWPQPCPLHPFLLMSSFTTFINVLFPIYKSARGGCQFQPLRHFFLSPTNWIWFHFLPCINQTDFLIPCATVLTIWPVTKSQLSTHDANRRCMVLERGRKERLPNSLTNFTSPWRKGKVAQLTFKKSSHTVQWQWGWWYWEGNRWPRSQTHVQLNSNSHMRCQGRFQMNCLNKKRSMLGVQRKEEKKAVGNQ